mgnify:CR=1 FL=1
MKNFCSSLVNKLLAILINDTVKNYITNYIIKLAAGSLGGWQLKIVTYLAKKLIKWGWAKVHHFKIFKHTEEKNEVIKEKYEDIIKKPDATHEEIKQAAPDFLGGDVKH